MAEPDDDQQETGDQPEQTDESQGQQASPVVAVDHETDPEGRYIVVTHSDGTRGYMYP